MYSVIYRVIVQAPSYEHPERLAVIWESFPARRVVRGSAALANIGEWRRAARSLERIEYLGRDTGTATLSREGYTQRVSVQEVSPGLLEFLGMKPLLGRVFLESEVKQGARLVLVSEHFWREALGGEAGALGRPAALDGVLYQIVGVVPRDFDLFTDFYGPDFLVPPDPREADAAEKRLRRYIAIARLRKGVPLSQARTEMKIIARHLEDSFPELDRGWSVSPQMLQDALTAVYKPALYPLFGAVLILLLIGCANVSNMLLMQTARRGKEIAMRAALGANLGRILRESLIEGLLLVVPAGLLGIALANWGLLLVNRTAPLWFSAKFGGEARLNGAVLLFGLLLCAVTGISVSVAPSWHVATANLSEALKSGSRASTTAATFQTRNFLVVAEVVLAFTLMVGAGLMITTMYHLYNRKLGYEPSGVFTAQVELSGPRYTNLPGGPGGDAAASAGLGEFCRSLTDRIRRMPGVENVAIAGQLPTSDGTELPVRVAGRSEPPHSQVFMATLRPVSPEYLSTMRVPLLAGRFFSSADMMSSTLVAVISESVARHYWPGESPIGRLISVADADGARPQQVVGIVRDVARTNSPGPRADLYVPFSQQAASTTAHGPSGSTHVTLLVRTKASPALVASALRTAAAEVDKTQTLYEMKPMEEYVDQVRSVGQFYLLLLAGTAAIAVLLAALGIYGVVTYAVTERLTEIGVRIALGATPWSVFGLLLWQTVRLTVVGVALGIACSLEMTGAIREVLFGVRPSDPLTLGLAAVGFLAIALLAAWQPARHATRVDPVTTLRAE
jgi:putative ABC transport system permease protein